MLLHMTTYQSSLKANENFKHQRHLKSFVLGHNFRVFSSKVWPWTRRGEGFTFERWWSGPAEQRHGAPASQPGGRVSQKDGCSKDGRVSRRERTDRTEEYSEGSEKDPGNM